MSTPIHDPDDPLLTAYALGQISPDERCTVEALLAASPEARKTVESIRSLARELEEEFTRENDAHQQAHPQPVTATNVVAFPTPPRRRPPFAVPGWQIAAMFLALGSLTWLTVRRTPSSHLATVPPAAPLQRAMPAVPEPQSPAMTAPGDGRPDEARKMLAAVSPERRIEMDKTAAQIPEQEDSRDVRASILDARVAEAPPAAARPAPPAAAPMTRAAVAPTMFPQERLAASLVRVQLDRDTPVSGVAVSADGWILAAGKLGAREKLGAVRIVLRDGREYAPDATTTLQPLDLSLFKINAGVLPPVRLAPSLPDKNSLVVVADVTDGGDTAFQQLFTGSINGRMTIDGDSHRAKFVFDLAGQLLALEDLPTAALAPARARTATRREEIDGQLVRPYNASERAFLARPPK